MREELDAELSVLNGALGGKGVAWLKFADRRSTGAIQHPVEADDSVAAWVQRYLDQAVRGVRSDEVAGKISRHLERFYKWLAAELGHDRVSAVTPREVATMVTRPRRSSRCPPRSPGRSPTRRCGQ
jgi:hypothetical protein